MTTKNLTMPARYIILRADKWLDTHGHSESMVVYEPDLTPQPTGLVAPDGRPIYRVRETVPMGFHHRIK